MGRPKMPPNMTVSAFHIISATIDESPLLPEVLRPRALYWLRTACRNIAHGTTRSSDLLESAAFGIGDRDRDGAKARGIGTLQRPRQRHQRRAGRRHVVDQDHALAADAPRL